MSWDEYIRGGSSDGVNIFGSWEEKGYSPQSLEPKSKKISTQGGGYVRFQFTKVCEHYSWTALGEKPYLPIMSVQGKGGKGYLQETWRAMETDGYNFWIDVPREILGVPGQTIMLCVLNKFKEGDARGVTKAEYDEAVSANKSGGVGGDGLATWELE
jgi:hypothetical protein